MADVSAPATVEAEVYPWVETLWSSLVADRARNTHAMMFVGARGLGKASCALAYTRHLVVGEDEQGAALFDVGTHPDVHVLMVEELMQEEGGLVDRYAQRYREHHTGKPKAVITIEQVRMLTSSITTFAHSAGLKVILIFDAHLMNRNAANALLKSLEEPPSNTVFLLVTDQPEKTPMTIRSRCTMVAFRPPPTDVALEWLRAQPGFEDGGEYQLAMAGGSPILAVEMYRSGYTDLQARIIESVRALWNRTSSVSEVATAWSGENNLDVIQTLQKLLADLARFSVSDNPASLYFPAQSEWLQRSAKRINLDRILKTFEITGTRARLLDGPTDQSLLMEDTAIAIARVVE